jgi:hypothetical protein
VLLAIVAAISLIGRWFGYSASYAPSPLRQLFDFGRYFGSAYVLNDTGHPSLAIFLFAAYVVNWITTSADVAVREGA